MIPDKISGAADATPAASKPAADIHTSDDMYLHICRLYDDSTAPASNQFFQAVYFGAICHAVDNGNMGANELTVKQRLHDMVDMAFFAADGTLDLVRDGDTITIEINPRRYAALDTYDKNVIIRAISDLAACVNLDIHAAIGDCVLFGDGVNA